METLESHIQKQTDRIFRGEEFGTEVVAVLNGHTRNPQHQERILRLFEATVELVKFLKPSSERSFYDLDATADARRAYAAFNKHMSRYKSSPGLVPSPRPSGRRFRFTQTQLGKVENLPEWWAAQQLLELLKMDPTQVHSIRQCRHCQQWFFARFAHQVCCTEPCRIEYQKSQPGYREYKAEKAKEYYWRHKVQSRRKGGAR
jgi:hypothetical protein